MIFYLLFFSLFFFLYSLSSLRLLLLYFHFLLLFHLINFLLLFSSYHITANMAAFYGVYHGPEGLRNIANRVHNMANNAGTPQTHPHSTHIELHTYAHTHSDSCYIPDHYFTSLLFSSPLHVCSVRSFLFCSLPFLLFNEPTSSLL